MRLFACELNPPDAIGSNLRPPGAIGGPADFGDFTFLNDLDTGRTFLLHDAQRIAPAVRGEYIGLRLNGERH